VRPLRRLGIFGGTFDPVHIAHLQAALEAHHALELDRTLLVVAPEPWQKGDRVLAPAAARFEMVEAAVADLPGLDASHLELDREGPTYTIDTVDALRARHDDVDLFLVVGADVAANIETWHRAGDLRELVTLAVVTRDGNTRVAPDGWRVEPVNMPRLDVSSTDVRARVAQGRPVEVLVPPGALRVLRAHALYTRL
jgi:nicotinate-nucleotide adenylyltransferase